MEYTFKTDISKEEFDKFTSTNQRVNFMQTFGWANVKLDFETTYVGMYDDNKLVATAILMVRTITKGIKLGYVPKGYLIDYTNYDILKNFTDNIYILGKKLGVYCIKIDPNFCIREYNLVDGFNVYNDSFRDYEVIHNNLLKLNYKHNKLYKEMAKTNQPRFNMSIPLYDTNHNKVSSDAISSHFKVKTRRFCKNFHKDRGVYFEHTNDLDYLDEFVDMINETQSRQGISLRNKEYFSNILKNMDSYLFFGRLDLNKYLDFISKDDKITDEQNLVNDLINEYGSSICLGAVLVIMPSNNNGIRVSEHLYAGNKILFNKLNVATGLIYDICRFSIENNCDYCNLGGVEGSLNDNLSEFKLKFNSNILEYIGEYDLVIKKSIYYPISKLFPLIKKLYKKIRR